MAKQMVIDVQSAIQQADTHRQRYDAASPTPGKIRIYGGTRPANPDTATGETVLCEITLQDPAFNAAQNVGGAAQISMAGVPLSNTAVAAGTATWCRLLDGANVAINDGNVGTGDFDLSLDDTNLTIGKTVTIQSWTITQPVQ